MEHLNNSKCIRNAVWNGDTLQCYCGRKIAIRYMIDREVRLFCYGKFKKYKYGILARKDTKDITKRSDLFGYLDNEEWDKIIRDIQQSKEDT